MIKIDYKPSFVRQFKKLEPILQEEVLNKISLFKKSNNHEQLKVHKLHGNLSNYFAFSVDYRIRIVFSWVSKTEVVLRVIGDHDVYK